MQLATHLAGHPPQLCVAVRPLSCLDLASYRASALLALYSVWCAVSEDQFCLMWTWEKETANLKPIRSQRRGQVGEWLLGYKLFLLFHSSSSDSCLPSTKQCTVMATATALASSDTSKPRLHNLFLSLCFRLLLFSLLQTLTFLIFFSLLSPFNYPSLGPCAVSYKVNVDGLCQEVHPALYNVATFCPPV